MWDQGGSFASAVGGAGEGADKASAKYVPLTLVLVMRTDESLGRSKNQGIAAVEQVLQARQQSDVLFERVASLEESLEDEDCTPDVRLYAQLHLASARAAWKKAKEKAARLERELGVNDSTVLKKLAHAPYYSARMNARALKERLRAKLRDRKFELDPIERSFRRTASGMSCL